MATTHRQLPPGDNSAAAAEGMSRAAPDAAAQAVLEQLHPLLLPAAPSWVPQTAAWGVLSAVVLLLLARKGWRGWRRWQANRYRRLAMADLQRLRAALRAPEQRLDAARELPQLVRRLALAHAPRGEVAQLQGEAWVAWLDRSLGDPAQPFTQGVGRRLTDWAYRPESALPWDELEPLLALLELWIRGHRVAGPPGALP